MVAHLKAVWLLASREAFSGVFDIYQSSNHTSYHVICQFLICSAPSKSMRIIFILDCGVRLDSQAEGFLRFLLHRLAALLCGISRQPIARHLLARRR
jgi:hypothetical protein